MSCCLHRLFDFIEWNDKDKSLEAIILRRYESSQRKEFAMTVLQFSQSVPTVHTRGRILRHFTPNWFATTMGTGILAVCLAQFPGVPAGHTAGQGLWLRKIHLFSTL